MMALFIGTCVLATLQGLGNSPNSPDVPLEREDANSRIAHQDLVLKARSGRIDLYFLGDSITRRWGTGDPAWRELHAHWQESFFGWNAANFGWGGDTSQNILWRIENGELDGVNPKVIVVLAGTNNIPSGASAEEIARGVKAILDTCRRKAPDATIVLTAIFPRSDEPSYEEKIDRTNTLLKGFANAPGVQFLNINEALIDSEGKLSKEMSSDGLHLTLEGYRVWERSLRPILQKLLGPRKNVDLAPPPTMDRSVSGSHDL